MEYLMIAAVLISPIFAIQVQKIIENWKEKKKKKMEIFRTLMTTRGNPVSIPHVQALNMIDIEFYGRNKKEQKVVESWKIYLDNLGDAPQDFKSDTYQSKFDAWGKANNDCLANLLHSMAICLGYNFDEVHLKKGAYVPKGHTDFDNDQILLRQATGYSA